MSGRGKTSSVLPERQLGGFQYRADPLADQTVAAFLGDWITDATDDAAPQWERIQTVNILLGQWEDNAGLSWWTAPRGRIQGNVGNRQVEGLVDDTMADALNHYIQSAQALPSWADSAQIERAEELFMEHGALSCILLFCSSLPECYVVPDLSSVLHATGQLEQNTEYRIRSTAAMIFPVMMHGGLAARGAGIAQVLKVRLIHAMVRNLILHGDPEDLARDAQAGHGGIVEAQPRPAASAGRSAMYKTLFAHGWNVPRDGLPCNQEELAYTLLTFGYVFLRSLRKLGIGLPPADEAAYLHAWNVVGHVLGIERALMVHSMEEGHALMAAMQARGRAHPVVPDPRPALGNALMQTMSDAIPWRIAKPFPPLMTRYLCGRETARDLGLQAQFTPWLSAALFWATLLLARVLDTLARLVFPQFSLVRALTRVLGYHFMSQVLMSQTRPLQLPTGLLNQVDAVVHGWSDDARAPRWLNRLEDRLTTTGSWSADLAGAAELASRSPAQRPN